MDAKRILALLADRKPEILGRTAVGEEVKITTGYVGGRPDAFPNSIILLKNPHAEFSVEQFPSQCGIVIFHGLGMQNLSMLSPIWEQLSHAEGYTKMMVSLIWTEQVEELQRIGWKMFNKFRNNRTGRTIYMMEKDVS